MVPRYAPEACGCTCILGLCKTRTSCSCDSLARGDALYTVYPCLSVLEERLESDDSLGLVGRQKQFALTKTSHQLTRQRPDCENYNQASTSTSFNHGIGMPSLVASPSQSSLTLS